MNNRDNTFKLLGIVTILILAIVGIFICNTIMVKIIWICLMVVQSMLYITYDKYINKQ